jgi:hypothetical protein
MTLNLIDLLVSKNAEVKIAIIYFWNLETKKYKLLLFRPEMTTLRNWKRTKSHSNHIFEPEEHERSLKDTSIKEITVYKGQSHSPHK